MSTIIKNKDFYAFYAICDKKSKEKGNGKANINKILETLRDRKNTK